MRTLSRPTRIGNLFLALALLSSPLALAKPEIWYDADGKIVKVGNRYLTDKEAFAMALQLKAEQKIALEKNQPSQNSNPPQALPVTPAPAPKKNLAQVPNNALGPISQLGLYYSSPSHRLHQRRSYTPFYSSYPASYYYHYNPSVYRCPTLYHNNYYRPRHQRPTGWSGYYQNQNGHSHWGLGYQGRGTSIRITR